MQQNSSEKVWEWIWLVQRNVAGNGEVNGKPGGWIYFLLVFMSVCLGITSLNTDEMERGEQKITPFVL